MLVPKACLAVYLIMSLTSFIYKPVCLSRIILGMSVKMCQDNIPVGLKLKLLLKIETDVNDTMLLSYININTCVTRTKPFLN